MGKEQNDGSMSDQASAFSESFTQAMMTDDEPQDKGSRKILMRYDSSTEERREVMDDVFISLCGYSIPTLRNPS